MARTFVQLDLNERRRLFELHEHNVTVADIARVMERHRSTIYREIKRFRPETHGAGSEDGSKHMRR